jgi:hypothetical protein
VKKFTIASGVSVDRSIYGIGGEIQGREAYSRDSRKTSATTIFAVRETG